MRRWTTYGGGGYFWEQTLRLSWQITAKNKIGAYYNNKKRSHQPEPQHDDVVWSLDYGDFFPFSDNL